MLPLPVFNPLDTTKYPNGNGYLSVGAGNTGSKLLLYNETPVNITINFLDGNQSILHAWEARYWTLNGDARILEWQISASLNVTNPPISLVIGELYRPDERVEGSYPMALIRQATVGNPGGLVTTGSGGTGVGTNLTNDGNAAGTSIVESTVTGQTSSSVTLTNDALLKLSTVIAGALVQVLKTSNADPVLQLGAMAHLAEVLGNFQVDGNTTLTGIVTATNASNSIAASTVPASGVVGTVANATNAANVPGSGVSGTVATANNANSVPASGVTAGSLGSSVTISGSSVTGTVANANLPSNMTAQYLNSGVANLPQGKLGTSGDGDILDASGPNGSPIYIKNPNGAGFTFQSPNGTTVWGRTKETHGDTGNFTGSGNFAHGMGSTPDLILVMPYSGGSTSTFALTNKGPTTFTIYTYTTMAFNWLAIKF